MVTVYRSGFITPKDEIKNIDSSTFDALALELTGENVNRSSTVFAGLGAEHTLDYWGRYRSSRNEQSCLYAVTYPDELLMGADSGVYAYRVRYYDYYFADMLLSDDFACEMWTKDYVNKRVHASEWYLIPDWEKKEYELLIPYDVAVQGEWSIIACKQEYCGHLDEDIPAEHRFVEDSELVLM